MVPVKAPEVQQAVKRADPRSSRTRIGGNVSISSLVLKNTEAVRPVSSGGKKKKSAGVSARRTLWSCDMSGKGGGSPEGSTASRAYRTAACRTPGKRRGNPVRRSRSGITIG